VSAGLVVVLTAAGCGGGGSSGNQASNSGVAVQAPDSKAAPAEAANTGATAAPAGTDKAASADVPAAPGPAAAPAAPGKAPAASTKTEVGAKAPAAAAPTAKKKGAKAAAGTAPAGASLPCTAALDPVRIGQVGTFSGLVGQTTGRHKEGLALWASAINATGGVQCHPVQLIAVDDQNDPQRSASLTEDLIVNKHVIAIVGAAMPISFAAMVPTLEKHKFPEIGGDLVDPIWDKSPYVFPQGGGTLSAFAGPMDAIRRAEGLTKTFILYCVEATICTTSAKSSQAKGGMADMAKVQVVGTQGVSLTQPSFTAGCQLAKDKGAQFITAFVDSASELRLARSCASIGYKVPIVGASFSFTTASLQDPYISAIKVYSGSPNAPLAATGLPALDAFRDALKKFSPGFVPDQSALSGWASGKLFEAAMAAVSAKARAGSITTDLVYEGLYSLKNETMDGLGPGVTFHRGGLPSTQPCYYAVAVIDHQYRAPLGAQKLCFAAEPVAG
jgi:branched-chain amino acid transport system substrate-binding protein